MILILDIYFIQFIQTLAIHRILVREPSSSKEGVLIPVESLRHKLRSHSSVPHLKTEYKLVAYVCSLT